LPRPRPLLLLATCLLLLVVRSPRADAQDERPPRHRYSEQWSGLFLGAGVLGGPAFLANDALQDSLGWAAGITVGAALVLTVLSLQLDYLHSEFEATADGDPFSVKTDQVAVSVNFHPAFLLTMYGPGFGYIAASVYVQFGLGADFTHVRWRERELDERWDVSVHWGAGFDVPLTSADRDNSLWLGFNYRWNDAPVDLRVLDPLVLSAEDDLRQHLFLFRVSWRNKGLPL
jgi:hypothetical protein